MKILTQILFILFLFSFNLNNNINEEYIGLWKVYDMEATGDDAKSALKKVKPGDWQIIPSISDKIHLTDKGIYFLFQDDKKIYYIEKFIIDKNGKFSIWHNEEWKTSFFFADIKITFKKESENILKLTYNSSVNGAQKNTLIQFLKRI